MTPVCYTQDTQTHTQTYTDNKTLREPLSHSLRETHTHTKTLSEPLSHTLRETHTHTKPLRDRHTNTHTLTQTSRYKVKLTKIPAKCRLN